MFNPERQALSGYAKYDGTVEFYGRIRSILRKDFVVADIGAGRGAWYLEEKSSYKKQIRYIKDDVKRLIGCDVDPAVMNNASTHENYVVSNGRLPLESASVDVIIADYVLEHVLDPVAFYADVERVLKPDGFFCARTPHLLNYVAIIARLVKNRSHVSVLKSAQPERHSVDVFPTAYRLNTFSAVHRLWTPQHWADYSYLYTGEPYYYFGRKAIYYFMCVLHKGLPESVTGNLFLFLRKRGSPV